MFSACDFSPISGVRVTQIGPRMSKKKIATTSKPSGTLEHFRWQLSVAVDTKQMKKNQQMEHDEYSTIRNEASSLLLLFVSLDR